MTGNFQAPEQGGFRKRASYGQSVSKRIIGNARGGHRVNQLLEIDPILGHDGAHGLLVGDVVDEILVRQIALDAVGDVDIAVTVVVQVHDERAPGPVRGVGTRHFADFTEAAVPVVEVEHVSVELVVVAPLHLLAVGRPILKRRGLL